MSNHASPALLGTLTIGQAPRADITPILQAALPPGTPMVHVGVLDGLTRAEIDARYAARPGQPMLITKLLDGTSLNLDKAAVRGALGGKLAELEAKGCTVILILCTGEFHDLALRNAWLVEPDHIVTPAAAAMVGNRQVGVILPLIEQAESEAAKFRVLAKPPLFAAASPYVDNTQDVETAARTLRDQGAQVLLLDCMGFTERHRDAARRASGLPVLLSNALIAKMASELVA